MSDTANPGVQSIAEQLIVARTPRLRIRYKLRADALDDFAWARDPEIARFNGNTPREQTLAAFLTEFDYDLAFGPPTRQQFAIETADGIHIGTVMYYNASYAEASAELGMTIGPVDYRDRGYGREAATAFLRFAWQTYPFRSFYLHTLAWNERAQRSFTAAGFTPSAQIRRNGELFVRMEARREWWLLQDSERAFEISQQAPVR